MTVFYTYVLHTVFFALSEKHIKARLCDYISLSFPQNKIIRRHFASDLARKPPFCVPKAVSSVGFYATPCTAPRQRPARIVQGVA